MTRHAVLLPVFVLVAQTFAVLVLMAFRRLSAVRAGSVRRSDISLGERAWPAPAQQAANAYSNAFELPVLFFALVPLALLTLKADTLFVVMSWIFVASRIVHAGAYVAGNRVPVRFLAFLVGVVVLFAMWAIFAIRILATPLPA